MERFQFQAARYPEEPGCYLMKNRDGDIIYVGKAVNLRKRLASYFQRKPDRTKTGRMLRDIFDVEIMIVTNENESLTLERNLIQYYRPKFNKAMKNESAVLPYIRLTGVHERYPYFEACDMERFGSNLVHAAGEPETLFGPYLNRTFRDMALEFAVDRFRLRTCIPLADRVCMRYYLQTCGGICEKKASDADYAEAVDRAASMLGSPEAIVAEMARTVAELAERLQFEKAKVLHTRMKAMQRMLEEQIVDLNRPHNQIAVYFGERHALAARLERGMLRRNFEGIRLNDALDYDLACRAVLFRLFAEERAPEIILNRCDRPEHMEEALRSEFRSPVKITLPKKGAKLKLLQILQRNFEYRFGTEAEFERLTNMN